MPEMSYCRELATQALITPKCRENRGNGGAWDEAVRRLREEYDAILDGWAGCSQPPSLQLVLYFDRPMEIRTPAVPPLPTEGSEDG